MEMSGIFDQPDPRRTLAIEVEGKKFWVSREMLATYSPVFNTMLYGEFAEANKDVITLPGKKAKDVEELLLCLLPHPRQKEIDDSNLEILMALSDEYQIDDIPIRAERFLMKKLHKCRTAEKGLPELLIIGSKYQMKKFLSRCIERCAKEFTFSQLKRLFPNLRSEVQVSLALAVLEPPMNAPCRQLTLLVKDPDQNIRCFSCRGAYCNRMFAFLKCSWCGKIYCAKCVDTNEINKKCG